MLGVWTVQAVGCRLEVGGVGGGGGYRGCIASTGQLVNIIGASTILSGSVM